MTPACEAFVYFLIGAVLALVWASYTHFASKGRAVAAALWGGGIYALGCFSAISYVAPPLARGSRSGLGDMVGTYCTIKILKGWE